MAYTYDGVQVDNHNQEKFWDWWKNNRSIGGGSSLYGGKDYYHTLKKQHEDSGWLGSVHNARVTAYEFFKLNPVYVNETHREGYTEDDKANVGGIGHNLMELMSGQGSARFIGAHVGLDDEARMTFIYEDFMHARSLGFSDREILEFLDGPGRAYKTKMFQPGQDNVYDHIWEHGNPDGYPYGGPVNAGETDVPTGTVTPPGTGEDVPGAHDGNLYGGADYIKALKDDWDTNRSTANLRQIRADALHYLETANNVHQDNRPVDAEPPGLATGLHNMIRTSQRSGDQRIRGRHGRIDLSQIHLTGDFGGYVAWTPEDKGNFTMGDYLAAKAGGYDEFDIYRYMFKNPSVRESDDAARLYNDIRQGLIDRGNESHSGDDYGNYHYYLESPLWQELGAYLTSKAGTAGIPSNYRDYDWWDFSDFRILQNYINDNFTSEMGGGQRGVTGYRTDDHLTLLTGFDPGEGTADSTSWEKGDYWKQYGASGPPDRDQGDGYDRSDLKWVEKMVAQSGLYSLDPSTAKTRLETLENKFIGELWGPGDLYLTADDKWGLDIVREVGDVGSGDRLGWSEASLSDDDWWTTLTRGRINWTYYQTNKDYLNALEQLGFDETKPKDQRKIDTVEEIRQANIYIHGQNQASTDVDIGDWNEYEDRRQIIKRGDKYYDGAGNEIVPQEPAELEITGYEGRLYWQNELKKPDTPETYSIKQPTELTAPTIKNPTVNIKRPGTIPDDWTIRGSTEGPPNPTPT